ncbi:hypothetical protein [Nocardioides sp. LS1]|uniref:hypothetical protein n=1 Tax=Nocardioides sp. LS1 TaxID=1027620 RepID=UPI000F61F28A|nr:hypothetical protein [Nocardioides sp. LS1]GCD91549.1 hypothetical protein NLS1_35550 [Nocardioides sp. LS1]
MTLLPDGLPVRPVLLPGLRVLRRDEDHLQVGIDPPRRLVVPDLSEVRALLEGLRRGTPVRPSTPIGHRTLAALHEAGLLVDADALDAALAAAADRAATASVFAEHGTDALRRLAARRDARVAVHAAPDLAAPLTDLLVRSGVEPVEDDADLVVVATDTVVPRADLDHLVREGLPHLVVSGGVVGPFVVPGTTACTRCVDAHHADADPRRSLLLEQWPDRPAPGPEPRDPVRTALTLAWAVREVVGVLDGDEPATWSATLEVGATGGTSLPRRSTYARHPHCGCSWGDALAG